VLTPISVPGEETYPRFAIHPVLDFVGSDAGAQRVQGIESVVDTPATGAKEN
jgi:hypothetical protein